METWQAFSRHPVQQISDFEGKRVSTGGGARGQWEGVVYENSGRGVAIRTVGRGLIEKGDWLSLKGWSILYVAFVYSLPPDVLQRCGVSSSG